MMYDETGGGVRLRTFNSMNMAWWHSYKHAAFRIYSCFSCEVFAPLWHTLYPNTIFYRKPKNLNNVLLHLMYVHLAFPCVSQRLDEVINSAGTTPASKTFAEDLKFLGSVAIPVVGTRSQLINY